MIDRLDLSKADTLAVPKPAPIKTETAKKKLSSDTDADTAAVYGLVKDEPLHPDEIAAQTGFPMPKVISSLMMLEINGFIRQTNGKNYVLNNQ